MFFYAYFFCFFMLKSLQSVASYAFTKINKYRAQNERFKLHCREIYDDDIHERVFVSSSKLKLRFRVQNKNPLASK